MASDVFFDQFNFFLGGAGAFGEGQKSGKLAF
jgi:hypothetical protein